MNVAYDLEFDLEGFLSSLEKRHDAWQRVAEYQDAGALRPRTTTRTTPKSTPLQRSQRLTQ